MWCVCVWERERWKVQAQVQYNNKKSPVQKHKNSYRKYREYEEKTRD